MIRPFVESSFVLQCNDRTKAYVFVVLLNMNQHLQEFAKGTAYSNKITTDIERRWHKQEQHLYMLAFALHPKYRMYAVKLLRRSEDIMGNWGTSKNVLSVARLVMATKFYFAKHRVWERTMPTADKRRCHNEEQFRQDSIRKHARFLGVEMKKWLQGAQFDDGFTHEEYNGGHPVEFWQDQVREHVHLATFAQWLLSQAVQSASCERLFKDFVQFHDKKRNKTHHDKVHKQAQVRRHIRRSREMLKQQKDKEKYVAPQQQQSKNRFVNPLERKLKEDARERTLATMVNLL